MVREEDIGRQLHQPDPQHESKALSLNGILNYLLSTKSELNSCTCEYLLRNFKSSLKMVISSSGDLSLDRKSVFDILILNVNKINSQLFTTGNYQEFQETGPMLNCTKLTRRGYQGHPKTIFC